jgi:hypothetical protein
MRLMPKLLLVTSVALGHASANPIVVDPERRPTTMTSERVSVSVGQGRSLVTGEYSFQQLSATKPSGRHRHVTVFVPVLLAQGRGGAESYESRYGAPRIRVGGRLYLAKAWQDITLEGAPASVDLPRDWYAQDYVCNVPLRYVGKNFDVKVEYVQPHFAGDIVAYIPIEPPRDPKASQIEFVAKPGRKLRVVSPFSFLSPAEDNLRVTPKHRKPIRVRSTPSERSRESNARS